ncbi:efflux RND transporter periplasmic adaptor subunit [Methylomonas sp. UP202]|uniref:efflux RND transporter periplasmic adaptor subunit n=1 Tax=Methylomonas sp. UP202 TaxID=3040943 RepID=UPI002478809B|nr:efflux RND transporter periplasmic adaptor subunit [Methylomonas sp. UP202]WGS85050.1 efflux RND transporter periplasmic adaptor subunit [Methylomonas sp. UP202]
MKTASWSKISVLTVCIVLQAPNPQAADEPEAVTEVAVQTGRILRATLHRYVMAYGVVEPEPAMHGKPAASSKIAAPIAGILTQSFCEEGQVIKKGTTLFELDTRSADALIAKAEVAVAFAEKNFVRKQQLNATDNVSRKLYDESEQLLQAARKDLTTAQTQRELLRIKAPLSGTVAAIHVKVGETIGLNMVLVDLIDLDRLDIALKIPSQEAGLLQLGQAVEIKFGTKTAGNLDAQPTQHGKVIFISPQVDSLTDTVLVRASINSGSAMRPGQFVSARIVVEARNNRLAVPVESVVNKETGSTIAVVEGNTAKQIAISPGLRDGKLVEITGDALQEGMTVVTQGAYGLPAETHIRVIE